MQAAGSRWDQWLRDNAHFGLAAISRASGVPTSTVGDDLGRLGLSVRGARHAKKLPQYQAPEGDMTKAPPRTSGDAVPEAATPEEIDTEARNKHLREENKRLQRELDKTASGKGKTLEALDELFDAMAVVEALPPIPPLYVAARKDRPTVVADLVLGDWHTGEVVRADITGGWGEYNYEILERRIHRLVMTFIGHMEAKRTFYDIQECHVFVGGDMVSGIIHDELRKTNEFPAPEQVFYAARLLVWVLRQLARHFPIVTVDMITDCNHGRLSVKREYKEAGINNFDWLVAQGVKLAMSEHSIVGVGGGTVDINIRTALRTLIHVGGKAFLTEHGHSLKGWSGFPWYGASKLLGREAMRRMGAPDLAYDYYQIFHFHQTAKVFDGLLRCNGTTKGVCEYSNANYPEATTPSQTGRLVSANHGIFDETDYDLDAP